MKVKTRVDFKRKSDMQSTYLSFGGSRVESNQKASFNTQSNKGFKQAISTMTQSIADGSKNQSKLIFGSELFSAYLQKQSFLLPSQNGETQSIDNKRKVLFRSNYEYVEEFEDTLFQDQCDREQPQVLDLRLSFQKYQQDRDVRRQHQILLRAHEKSQKRRTNFREVQQLNAKLIQLRQAYQKNLKINSQYKSEIQRFKTPKLVQYDPCINQMKTTLLQMHKKEERLQLELKKTRNVQFKTKNVQNSRYVLSVSPESSITTIYRKQSSRLFPKIYSQIFNQHSPSKKANQWRDSEQYTGSSPLLKARNSQQNLKFYLQQTKTHQNREVSSNFSLKALILSK